jgi:MFS family permease
MMTTVGLRVFRRHRRTADSGSRLRISAPDQPGWSAWRVVVGFGLVSLAADMVYEGARSVYGPLLASLGASAFVVGLVTGAGEAVALVLRLVFGPLADRTGRYWSLTLVGYALTAICVPLLAVTPMVGAAGLALACTLIMAERAGKAVRSPSKTALLAYAAGAVGRGRGFAVHKALDQVGSLAGPLVVAVAIAATSDIWPAMALLAVPGVLSIALLLRLRRRVPDPVVYEPASVTRTAPSPAKATPTDIVKAIVGANLPRAFFVFSAAAGAATAGLVTFGIIGFHLIDAELVPLAAVPLVYAAGMASAALAALASGYLYDRWHARVLYVLPMLVTMVPALALSRIAWLTVIGVLVWGAATGLQDSTVKALVADLVPGSQRATAYGVFAAVQGAAAVIGGGVAGALYTRSIPGLVAIVAASQVVATILLAAATSATSRDRTPPDE